MGFSFNIYYMAINYAAKYNPSQTTITGCTQVGNIAVSTDMRITDLSGFSGGVDDTNGYIIISDTVNAGLVGRSTGNHTGTVGASSVPTYWRSPSRTSNSFLSLSNNLPARRYQTPFISSQVAKTWLTSNGYFTDFEGFILDIYPSASVAYSLRKLNSAYNGDPIRIRRSGDDAETDIGFVNNVVDESSIVSFVGENIWTFSEDTTQATWAKTGVSGAVGATSAPDGSITGNKVSETAVTSSHQIVRSSGTMTSGSVYNVSIYLKAGERTKCYILSQVPVASVPQCLFDLITGSVSGSTFPNPITVTDSGNGWWRFSTYMTSGGTSTGSALILRLVNDSLSTTYLGDITKGIYVWGSQFTQTTSLLNYTKTVTSAGGSAFITTWYDQSGNSNHATQNTPSTQAQICQASGVLRPVVYSDPNTGKLSSLWSSDTYLLTSPILISQKMMHTFVFNRIQPISTNYSIGLGSAQSTPGMTYWAVTSNNVQSALGTGISHFTADTSTGSQFVQTLRDGSNVVKMWKNGVAGATGSATNVVTNFTYLGKYTSPQHSGYMNEVILWKQDYESVREEIAQNINNYYGIY